MLIIYLGNVEIHFKTAPISGRPREQPTRPPLRTVSYGATRPANLEAPEVRGELVEETEILYFLKANNDSAVRSLITQCSWGPRTVGPTILRTARSLGDERSPETVVKYFSKKNDAVYREVVKPWIWRSERVSNVPAKHCKHYLRTLK